jgi:hypothetical protein
LFFNCAAVADKNSSLQEQANVQAFFKGQTTIGFHSKGDFTRLREVSAVFRIPRQALRYAGASGGTLVLAGSNLFIWSSCTCNDPEIGATNDIEVSTPLPPLPRTFVLRFNLSY